MIRRLLRALTANSRPRVDGVTATAWRNGWFTKGRTDLPYGRRR